MSTIAVPSEWDWGTDLAEELLGSIALIGKRAGASTGSRLKKIESEDFTIYWAGTVLRIDIPEKSLV